MLVAIPVVVSFLIERYDAQVRGRAAATLRLIMEGSEPTTTAATKEPATLKLLQSLVSGPCELARCQATLTMAEACKLLPAIRAMVVDLDRLHIFMRMARSTSTPQRYAGLLALASLVSRETGSEGTPLQLEIVGILSLKKMIPYLAVLMIRRSESPHSMMAVYSLSAGLAFHSESVQAVFAQDGCIPALINAIQYHKGATSEEANAVLSQILRLPSSRALAVQAGAVPVLCNRLEAPELTPLAVAESALALAFLADVPENKDVIAMKAMSQLSKLIRFTSKRVLSV